MGLGEVRSGWRGETAGKELERVEHKHGKVTPELVLEESRSKKAPLHKIFEWNDSVAAEKYRLTQAGQIINNLVVVLDEYEQHEPVRAFVYVNANAPKKKANSSISFLLFSKTIHAP